LFEGRLRFVLFFVAVVVLFASLAVETGAAICAFCIKTLK
jgi:hypothetical protein